MELNSFANDGYVVDVPYVNGFFKELTPSYLKFLLMLQQCDLPERDENEPLRYLELGFGQGSSLSIHAVSCEGDFWGTDFNPVHVLTAQKNIQKAQAKAQILCDSFGELAHKSKNGLLPNFDVIVLHGIWSWINAENREHILNIISHSLKTGGIVYVSYNALPGFANFTPVRDFLTYHASAHSHSTDSSIERFKQGYELLSKVKDNGSQFFQANPVSGKKFEDLANKNLAYLVHEYMNKDWDCFYFKDVAKDMQKAKCSFVASARPLTSLGMLLPDEVKKIMEGMKDISMIETLRDYVHNTQFRCDIFSKGRNILDLPIFVERFDNLKITLLTQKENLNYRIATPIGEVQCKEEVYKPLIEFLASDNYAAKSIKDIREIEEYKNISVLLEVLLLLVGSGIIHPVEENSAEIMKKLEGQCSRLNNFIFQENLRNKQLYFMASPVIGGGVQTSTLDQAFIFAGKNNCKALEERVNYVNDLFVNNGLKLSKDGEELAGDNLLAHIKEMAVEFEKRLPLLKALKLV